METENIKKSEVKEKDLVDLKEALKEYFSNIQTEEIKGEVSEPTLKILASFKFFRSMWYQSLKNYPNHEKPSLVRIIKENLILFESLIQKGRFIKSIRLKSLQEAQAVLFVLKSCLEISDEQKYISKGFKAQLDLIIEQVSKMLVSFISSTSKKK